MLDQRAQRIAVGGDDDALAGLEFGHDGLFPIGQHAGDRVFQAFGGWDRDAGIAAIGSEIEFTARLQRRRRDVEAAAPDLYLVLAIFGGGVGLVEAGKAAVVAFVQLPVLGNGQPQPAHGFQREIECLDRPALHAGEGDIEIEAGGRHALAGGSCFRDALISETHVPPASETIFEVPLALAVAEEDEAGHGRGLGCRAAAI